MPVSVCSIGMGYPNMDFFVREVRESVSGDMAVIRFETFIRFESLVFFLTNVRVRLGSCGCLIDHPVGSIVVPKASVAITRNYDYDFTSPKTGQDITPYFISKPVRPQLAKIYLSHLSLMIDALVDPGGHGAVFYPSQHSPEASPT
jgi:uridine phosphorylase